MDRLEAATAKRIDGIRNDVLELKHHLSQHESQLDDVKRAQTLLENRLDKLEKSGTMASTSVGESVRRLSLILGGWPSDTRKDDLLDHVKHVLSRLDLTNEVDKEAFCPGIRRGFAILDFVQREGETEADTRGRMSRIIREINTSDYQAPGMLTGKKVWSSVNKGPQERLRAAHASKTRKIIHVKKGNMIQQAETEYSSGSLWLANQLVCSAVRPRPREADQVIVEGKAPGSWLNATALGR